LKKISEIPYVRLEYKELEKNLNFLISEFKSSKSADEAIENFNKVYAYLEDFQTNFRLARIRHTLNLEDEYYSKEVEYIDEIEAKLQVVFQEMGVATLNTPFRNELEEKWGKLLFINEEIELKIVSPEIIEYLQKESKLKNEYNKLTASAKIEFDGKVLNLSQIGAYLENLDRDIRKNALNSMANWYIENKEKLDNIFSELTELRTSIAKKLGFENFVELGYYRNIRNCYDSKMVAEFRKGILEYHSII